MPAPRENPEKKLTNAEKQARHRARRETDADRLRGKLYQLEQAVWQAADCGDALADTVKATTAEAIIEKLTAHFNSIAR